MGVLSGKTALITGAGRPAPLPDGSAGAIGYGVALAFAREGADLVLTGRNAAKLEAAREELARVCGARVLALPADIRAGSDNEGAVRRVVAAAIEAFGRLDVLVNNAQASASGVPLSEHTLEQFDLAVYSGLYATFLYMRECFPHLREHGGCVINFASGAGLFGNAGQASYAAAKEGIRGLSRVAATEWAKDGVTVHVLCPLAWTTQLETFRRDYPDAFRQNVRTPPLGRFAHAERDIGRVCVQLTQPDFAFLTGETLTLEGGLGLRP